MESVKESIKEFLQSSSIHGLVYISTGKRYLRLIWLCVVIAGFSVAGVLIQQSFSSWGASPVTTTLETLPISELDFPKVTVCPPRNTFTSFIPDLVRSRNMTFKREELASLSEGISYATYDALYKARLHHFEGYRQSEYLDLYSGVTKMDLPSLTLESEYSRHYQLYTTSFHGTFSTLDFKQPFNEDTFERVLTSEVHISVPEGLPTYLYFNGHSHDEGWIYILIEYDIKRTGTEEQIYVKLNSSSRFEEETVNLDKTQPRKEFRYNTGLFESVDIYYQRNFETEYSRWTDRRNTGMRVYWFYYSSRDLQLFTAESVGADTRFIEDNKYFIQLANIIHEDGVTHQMEEMIINHKMSESLAYEGHKHLIMYNVENPNSIDCSLKEVNWIFRYFNQSFSPIYIDEITEDTLQKTAAIYFANFFCPDYDPEISWFYRDLTGIPLDTALRYMTRILFVANEKNLTDHYNTAKPIFDEITTLLNLQYKDIAVMTTAATELKLYQELQNHQVDPDISKGMEYI